MSAAASAAPGAAAFTGGGAGGFTTINSLLSNFTVLCGDLETATRSAERRARGGIGARLTGVRGVVAGASLSLVSTSGAHDGPGVLRLSPSVGGYVWHRLTGTTSGGTPSGTFIVKLSLGLRKSKSPWF